MIKLYEGVFEEKQGKKKVLLTESLTPGRTFFDEEVIKEGNKEFRIWNPAKSKLAASIVKGVKVFPFKKDAKVLYLGCAHGYTVSYLSEIVTRGVIIALDFAPRVFRDFMAIADARPNVIPIIADANKPESYYHLMPAVDIVFQDVAQRNQVEIFMKNCKLFLKKGGYGFLAVKARSVDVSRKPEAIFAEVGKALKAEFEIVDKKSLEPFQHDHVMFVVRK
ncbi:fibrillarin-like rRNA/tRNA 2'-O-methyltransferase [Candidatus Woesearchaeota archaeon]|nr:fibrillarin-like rRNA/tRNA 2'-O-methyltransferase [Candidatus Woesearchaeota archaeon]